MSFHHTERVMIRVTGIVQGVGFRPFVYRVACGLGLGGLVRNTSGGVEIEVEGSPDRIEKFLDSLKNDPPPLARVDKLETNLLQALGEKSFRILTSQVQSGEAALISPDVATCEDCRRELMDPSDRRHRYPFINCTNCGPRFTIVENVPYDRARTTMRAFTLCPACRREYTDPADRRFHAEPNACPLCGPQVFLLDPAGRELGRGEEAIRRARAELSAGKILAVKGLGGFHLACDATCDRAVLELRQRKRRPHKPLAVMCRDVAIVQACCLADEAELRKLQSPARPILLLKRREKPADGRIEISPLVAPARGDLGVMLPYTPLHYLLLEEGAPPCLVMTSGNRSEEPIVIDNEIARKKLGSIADFFLVHNRPIWNRCDDSVGYLEDSRLVLVRRSRGYVPLPLELPVEVPPTLALGAMYSNTFALAAGRRLFFSQHIGDVDNTEALAFLRESIEKLERWLEIEPEVIVCDRHPDLLTTRLAEELAVGGKKLVKVQHHHAHLVSALAACGHRGEAQGLVLDGTGWGDDRTIWGGELLVGSARSVKRLGHLRPLPLPGGEAAIRRPARLAAAYLHGIFPQAGQLPLDLWKRMDAGELQVTRRMVERGFNTPLTSSAGRLFDAVAALLGVRDEISYEGQAAIELEQLALACSEERSWPLPMDLSQENGMLIFEPAPLFEELIKALGEGVERERLAFGFHAALADCLVEACRRVQKNGGPRQVALGGGVFQNRLLTRLVARGLSQCGLVPLLPGVVPVNDGGLALGQVLIAAGKEN
jgi:hydrogenase maturation protein HypF